jgi:multiple antibiotic resistance protein
MNWAQLSSFLISLIAILNPAGSVGVFLGMTSDRSAHERRQIALVATLTIFITLIVITWVGIPILNLFGISLPAFEVTGGLIILLRGLEMLNSKETETPTSHAAEGIEPRSKRESIAVVPLAIPIIAGPGAMTNVIIFSQNSSIGYKLIVCGGILIVSLIMGIVLFFASRIGQFIGETGINITTRIMGLLLAAIAMSMIMTGLVLMFPGWS